MVRRGSRDLFRLPDCFDKLKECDPPTKYAEDLVALHDLFIDGLDVVKKRCASDEENGFSIAATGQLHDGCSPGHCPWMLSQHS